MVSNVVITALYPLLYDTLRPLSNALSACRLRAWSRACQAKQKARGGFNASVEICLQACRFLVLFVECQCAVSKHRPTCKHVLGCEKDQAVVLAWLSTSTYPPASQEDALIDEQKGYGIFWTFSGIQFQLFLPVVVGCFAISGIMEFFRSNCILGIFYRLLWNIITIFFSEKSSIKNSIIPEMPKVPVGAGEIPWKKIPKNSKSIKKIPRMKCATIHQ